MADGIPIGTRIARRRQALGMRQEDLAARVGVSRAAVANWESGKHFPLRKLGAVEQALGISLDDEPESDDLPTPEELARLHEHIREVLGDDAGPVSEAVDAAVTGAPLRRRRGAASGRYPDRRRAAGAS